MRTSLFPVFLIALIFLASCHNADRSVSSEPIPVQKDAVSVPDTNTRKLIKEADLSFETEDIEATAIQIRLMATAHKAYLAEENRFEYDSEKGYNFTVRVPAADFDKFMQEILTQCNVKKLQNKSIRVNDVTDEYIDVDARLKVKKETEAHYLELLKQARSLEETVELETQLSNLRSEIESAEGRIKFLSNQVDYSTIHIGFTEKKGLSNRFLNEIADAIKGGWQVFLKVIIGVSYLWVLIVLFFIGRWGFLRYRRRQKKEKR